jgi:sugar lactone lactonase YvrE
MWSAVVLVFAALVGTSLSGTGVSSLLAPGRDWELLGQGYQLTSDSAVDKNGEVYFTDARHDRIYKVDSAGKITLWKENSGGAHGIAYGPDGRLYAGQHDRKRIVALGRDGKESIVAEGVQTHHLTVTERGVYFADAPNHKIWLVDAAGQKREVSGEVNWPHGLRVSPDQRRLVVTDPPTRWVWSFAIERDGSLTDGQRLYRLETPDGSSKTDAGLLAFDSEGFLYVSSDLGVQVFDRAGRAVGIIKPPGKEGLTDVFFGGPHMQWLFVKDGERIYRRLMARRGASVR